MRKRRADHKGRRRVFRDRGREVLVDPANVAVNVDRLCELDPRGDSGRHEAARREGGVRTLDLKPEPGSPPDRAVSMLLLLGFLMHSAELRVEPDESDGENPRSRILYYLDASLGEPAPFPEDFAGLVQETRQGDWIVREVAPLPAEMTPRVVRVLRWLAGVDSTRGRLARALRRLANAIDGGGTFDPQFGRFDVTAGDHRINVLVGVYPSKDGDRFIIHFGPPGASSGSSSS